MEQNRALDSVMDARYHFKNGETSKNQMNRNFILKYKSLFILGLTSLILMLTLYYLDEGIHKLPNDLRGYFEVVMGSIYASIIPMLIFFLTGLSKKLRQFRLILSLLGFLPIMFLIYMCIRF